jgi:iron complex outermembrane receptor protein
MKWICAILLVCFAIEGRCDDLQEATKAPSEQGHDGAAAAGEKPKVFKKMTLDELMDIEVTSVSKRESTIGQSAAAVSVITQDDIRRSGATSIAEALRMAPGMEVARIDNSTWAISARGFNSSTANKLLVLMDGRSVYSPLYSGVFWDVQDTLMQDIDRIEVIRGPAGALWGANAVNGVINIITKDAKDTQGLLVTGGGGTEERDFAGARYGWKLGDDTFARVYVKHFERDETQLANGAPGADDWFMTQAGFRIDSNPSPANHYTLQGDIYGGARANGTALNSDNTDLGGGNVLGLWTHTLAQGGDIKLQMYYDRTERNIPMTFKENRDTFDIDFQYHVPLSARQDLTWGLGYRVTSDQVGNSAVIKFIPSHRVEQLFSAFVQDEIQIVPDRLRLTLGTKIEHNDFSGFEVQPSARLLWTIDKRQNAWAAVSRAVRTPTRLEEDLQIVAGSVSVFGNRRFESETVIAYELGYRVQPVDWLALDVATFYNDYDKLRSVELVGNSFVEDNKLRGQTYGVELGSTLKAAEWWRIRTAYTYLQVQLQNNRGSTDFTSVASAGNDPMNQVYVRSSMDLPHHVELDGTVRYVSALTSQNVPGYVAVDVRLAWRPNEHMELALVGQNLLDNQHPEFGSGINRHEIERGAFVTFTYRW